MPSLQDIDRERRRKAVFAKLKDHDKWIWTLLGTPDLLEELVPWPLLGLFPKLSAKRGSKGSRWATMAITWTAYLILYSGVEPDRDTRYASEASRILFTGAFLLGTLLGLTNTAAGSAIRRSVRRDATAVLEVGATFAWGLLFGLLGGTALMFYASLYEPVKWFAILLGVFGGFMELNLMLYTLRMVLLGWVVPAPAVSEESAATVETGSDLPEKRHEGAED